MGGGFDIADEGLSAEDSDTGVAQTTGEAEEIPFGDVGRPGDARAVCGVLRRLLRWKADLHQVEIEEETEDFGNVGRGNRLGRLPRYVQSIPHCFD